jgi:hypothetical protein
MSEIILQGFAYGEELDTLGQRSLGYHLLAPAGGTAWGHEVETLARRLQAAPYPDSWPAVDLFCSVLLAKGQRVVAVASYGLSDHAHDPRRGGLELIGVVSEKKLSIPWTLAIYRWLNKRRVAADGLHSLGGHIPLTEVLATAPHHVPAVDPLPAVPNRLWHEGALLLGATLPSSPDDYLRWLELNPSDSWQWLPLVGAEYPLQEHARHGPLVAWTPHLVETPGREGGARQLHLLATVLVERH